MLTLVALVLAAAPGTMVMTPFAVQGPGATPALAASSATQVAERLRSRHYSVVEVSEAAALLGPAGDTFVACGAEVPCLAKFAAQLQVKSALLASLSASDGGVSIELRVVGLPDGVALGAATGHAASWESLDAAFDAAVQALVVQFDAGPAPAPPPATGLGTGFWAPVVVGVVVMGIAGVNLGLSLAELDLARSQRATLGDAEADARIAKAVIQRNVSIAGLSLGAASVLSGVLFGRPAPEKTPAISLLPVHGGAQVTVAWGF